MPGTTSRGSRSPVHAPAVTPPAPAPVMVELDADPVEPDEPATPAAAAASGYPVVYYNPRVPSERFYIGGSAHPVRFTSGRFAARNQAEEQAVRAALRRFGPAAADRWRGDDMKREWASKAGDFRTRNEHAKDDYETYHAS